MKKPQITVKIDPNLLQTLKEYAEECGTSKTDVVISAISQYLNCSDSKPLSQRMAELERRVDEIEAKEKVDAK